MENDIYTPPKTESKLSDQLSTSINQSTSMNASELPLKRLGAFIVDSCLLTVFQIFLSLFIYTNGLLTVQTMLLMPLLTAVIYLALHGHLLINHGQTIGKRLLKIKIVTIDGQKAKVWPHLSLRLGFIAIFSIMPVIGPAVLLVSTLLIFSQSQRCGHDHVAGTKVVYC